MDFFQRLGNFFTGKGWVSDEEKRRKEQQAQQPQQRPQPVQQPQLNNQPRMNIPWANNSGGLNQSSQPKVNLNPLQQANQVNQQLNINSQNNQAKPQLTVDDAPKMLTPEGQQDWVNKQNKQIQIQNANSQPIQQPRPQQVQQPQPQAPKPVPVQPQQPRPQTITSPNVINQQNDMRRMGIDPNPVHTAIQHANDELNQYRTAQSNRQDIIDNKMRARGVSEPEIAKNRQTRIQLENQARASADEARRSQNMANIVGAVTAPGRAVASATKGFIDGAGRTVGDTGDKMSLAIADAMYGITGDEKYNKTRQRIIQQGQQRNAQYDKQFGVFKKNDTDVDVAYELGQSGQRLIQGMGTGVATAGVAPVARAFAENAADFVTDANTHGKNTRDVLPAAYANAAAQAAIEKVGLDRVLLPGGKTVARRMIKSALAEGGEEAAQQLTENAFAKHTYDPDRKYSEGVVKSALMGAALGGPAGAGNFGGVRQTENQPSAAMSAQIAQSQQTQQQAPGKLEQEALVQRQVRQSEQQRTQQTQPQAQNQTQNTNQSAGYSDFYRRPAENTSLRQAAEVNAVNTRTSQTHPIQQVNVNQTVETTMPNASPALKQAVSRNISDIQHGDTNAIATRQQTTGKLENYLIEQATHNIQDTVAQGVRYKMDNQSNTQLSTDPVMNVRNADGETMADMTARLQNEGVSPQGIQMETGKFRNTQQQVPGGDGRIKTMSLDSDVSERAVRSFNSVRRGKQIKSVVGQLSENGARKVAEALRSTDFNKKARLVIDKNAVNHLRNSGHLTGLGKNGADANPLTEADIRALPHVFSDPDVVYMSGTGRTGKRMVFERQLDNHHRIVAELEYSGKDFNLVTYFNINKDLPNGKPAMSYSPEGAVAADESGRQPSRPGRSSSDPDNGFINSLANNTQNVNNDNRYKLEEDDSFYDKPRPSVQDVWGTDSVSLGYSQDENGNLGINVTPENTNEPNSITHTIQETSTDSKPPSAQRPLIQADRRSLRETVESQPLKQNQAQEFKNVPMEEGHLLTKGNLYEQTKPGIQDDWTKPFQDGDYEYRLHTKRSRDGKKSFNSFERRYVGDDGEYGDWMPTSRAAYIWKSQTKKIDKVNRDQAIQEALKAAKQDGEVQEFMAYENPDSAGGVAVVPLVGEHSIDGGFVRNPKTGEIEGNYIQVTPFGVVHQTNGKFDVLEVDHLTSALDRSKGGITDNFNRLVEKNVKDELGQKLLKDLYYQKTEAYANYADAVENIIDKHKAIVKYVDEARPRFKNEKKFWEDVGMYTEGKFPVGAADESMQTAFAKKYGEQAAARVKEYNQFMRENYDSMIENLNEIRRMYGKDEVPYLKNYMPHIQKRSGMLGRAVDKLLAASPVGIKGDIESQARGEIPASLAGLSADFKPTHKFNANEKQRRGGMMDYEKDPRKAFEYYTDVMLYNTHMEPVIARGRQIESSMRAMDMARKNGTRIDPDSNLAQGEKISNKATIAVQDFVNEMAGKSSSLDRPFIDRTNAGVQVIRRLESVNGANKILGNLSSTLAQALNLPETVRDNGLRNTGRAFLTAFQRDTKEAMHKSAFLRERYTDTEGKFIKSNYQKATNAISVVSGMNLVEKKFIQLNWAANYNRFKKQGLTGYQLIKAADQATERAVGGRGIGAMPQVYKSTLGKMFLQFSYETNESWKNNIAHAKKIGSDIKRLQFKDGASGAVRAAEAFVVAYGLNLLMKQITGNEPLANMADAIKDALSNDADGDGEDDKLGQKIVRVAGEATKANPFSQAAVNMIPKSEREKIFGKSSDFGRFDGATGVAQTASNLLGAGFYAVQGDKENTEKNLRGLIPAGNQIKKTTEGAQLLREGADTYTDKYGKTRTSFEVDNNDPWTQAKALLFGKNAVRPDEKANGGSGTFTLTTGGGEAGKAARDFERGLKKGEYKIQDGLLVNKKGDVQREYYKNLATAQGESDEAYSNWMKAYNIDDVSTLKKEFKSSNDILNKLENGEKKDDKAKSAVDILMGKHKDLPDWAKERYYKESGYSKEQIEYGAMTTHKEVSLMDNYWRQKAQESSHEELMQALTNGRRKSIVGQMFAKNGIVNKLKAEGYITKQEAKALNAAEFDVDGNRITKEGSGGSGSERGGSGRGRGRSGVSTASPLISAAVKSINSLSSAAPKANKTSGSGRSIDQIGKNLISRMNTQKQVNTALKQWNGGNSSKKPRVRTTKARA